MMKQIDVYLETGKKRTVAGALAWPGWCRIGPDEQTALQTLVEYGPRYAAVLHAARLDFTAPEDTHAFNVVERLEGDSTTDFGAPGKAPSDDERPLDQADRERFEELLKAYWAAFDTAVRAAAGKELRKGPRGGGRDLEKIIGHVLEAEKSYLARIGQKVKLPEADLDAALQITRQATLDGLDAALRGEIPTEGPRGGKRWTPRYFVRRSTWHVLDHVWEIEDRVIE